MMVRCSTLLLACWAAVTGCASQPAAELKPTASVVRTIPPPQGWTFLYARHSPDGSRLAIFGIDPTHIPRVAYLEDDRIVPILTNKEPATDFAWMPDSTHLVVALSKSGDPARLLTVALDGRVIREVAPTTPISSFFNGMAVSPSGDVAILSVQSPSKFLQPTDLVRINLQSGQARFLTETSAVSEQLPEFLESSTLPFTARDFGSDDPLPRGAAHTLDLTSGVVELIDTGGLSVDSATFAPPSSLLFVGGLTGRSGLYRVSLQGRHPQQLLIGDFRMPDLSPNSTSAVLVDTSPAGGLFEVQFHP